MWSLRALQLTVAILSVTPRLYAADTASRSAARDLGYEGVEAYQSGDYATALDRLERAYAVLQVPSLGLWSARALEKSGKLVEAAERYLEATRLTPDAAWGKDVQEQAQTQAAEERRILLPRIPRLQVVIHGADPEKVEVTVRGVVVARALYEVGLPTNPGQALVSATANGKQVEANVTVQEGKRQTVTLDFPAASSPAAAAGASATSTSRASEAPAATKADTGRPGRGQRTAGWIGVGVGSAGLILGAVSGIIAIGQNSELATACPTGTCPNDQADALANYQTMRMVSSVGLIAGGVLAATGVTLLLTAPKQQSAFVAPYVGFASAGLRGAF